MIVTYGNYCLYNDIEMQIKSFRYDHPISESEREYGLFYAANYKLIEGFQLHPHENDSYFKGIKLNEIANSYKIETKAHYREYIFLANTNPEKERVNLFSNSKEIFEKLGFKPYQLNLKKSISKEFVSDEYYFKVHNGFLIEVSLYDINEIWKERSESTFDLPMPEGLEKNKTIWKNPDKLI